MARGEVRSNAWLWATLLALVSAAIAAVAHAVVAFYTVTGASFDWLTWDRQREIEPVVAAVGMGVAGFVVTLVLTSAFAGIAWFLIGRTWLRGSRYHGQPGRPATWSEFSFVRSVGLAALGGFAAGFVGYLAAAASDGEVLSGQQLLVWWVATGAVVAAIAAWAMVAALAHAKAMGRIVADNPRGNIIGRIQLFAARQAIPVVLTVAVLTAGLGYGVTLINTDVDVADVLPRGDGNTTAAQNLTANFKSTFTQQVTLQFRINPDQCSIDSEDNLPFRATDMDCTNISDEVYVRALDEFFQILLDEGNTPIAYNIGLPSFYNLINWTLAGGEGAPPESFALPAASSPEEALQYRVVHEGVWRGIPSVVTPTIAPDFEQAASLYLVDTEEEASTQEIGQTMLAFRDQYVAKVERGQTTWNVWGADNPPLFTVDLPVANAHASELTREDFATLFPLIFAFIVVTLYFSFRNIAAIGIAGATLLIASVWTFGLMGYMGIALNTLNLTVLPLILGVGIDFAIHQITEFANHKREGMTDEEALRVSGGFAGFAMFIATVTSSSGLMVMTISPSLLMAQVGFLSAIAIVSVYLLTILFIPALLRLARSSSAMGRNFAPSRLVANLARMVSRRRAAMALLVVLISGTTLVTASQIGIEEFGEPARNFPEDDPLRIEHEVGIRGFYDIDDDPNAAERKTNIIVFEGDNTDIQAHRYIEAVQAEMANKSSLDLSTSRTLPFLLRTWLTVKDGATSAAPVLIGGALDENAPGPLDPLTDPVVEGTDNYPTTRAGIQQDLEDAFASPLATFASLFVDSPEWNISIMTFATETGDFEVAEQGWNDVWTSIRAVEDQRPHDLQPAFVGNTALNYLFITKELPWLQYLGIVSGLVVMFLSIIFTKSVRATVSIVAVMLLTTSWWLGILTLVDIGLAITLMLPAVFITSIGSDYAVHLTWNLLRNPDREEVYSVVGKAVLYSMITTVGAFAIFTRTQNVAASKAMVATVIAIFVIFLVTMMVLPLFYPLKSVEDEWVVPPEREEEDEGVEPPTTRIVERTPSPDAPES